MKINLRLFIGSAISALIVLVAGRLPAEAAISTMCLYAASAGSTYDCSPNTVNFLLSGENGQSAYKFTHNLGYGLHISYSNTSYGAPNSIAYRKAILLALHAHLIRDGSALGDLPPNIYTTELNDLAASGIKSDLIVNNHDSIATITARIGAFNANTVAFLEGPNELNINDGGGNWALDDQNEMRSIYSAVNGPLAGRGLKIIGPSITNLYTDLGDLSALIDYGCYHYYSGAYIPESQGWGGGYYGFNYGDLRSGLGNARQSSVTKPIAITETGEEVQPIPPNAGIVGGYVSEYTQASYEERRTLWAASHGVPLIFIYDLFSEGYTNTDFNWGLVRADGSQRPSLKAMQGLTNILDDTADISQHCHIPVTPIAPPPITSFNGSNYFLIGAKIESVGFCKSNGEFDLVIWQPTQSTNINTGADIALPAPLNIPIQFDPGFIPTTSNLWSTDTTFTWSNAPSISTSGSTIAVTDRPEILVFNGPSAPSPIPALPAPVPLLPTQ